MDWRAFPFCLFGYGCPEDPELLLPPPAPEESSWNWNWNFDSNYFPSIAASLELKMASLAKVINPEIIFYVFVSSVVSAFVSCTFNYIWNQESADKKSRSAESGRSLSHVSLESGEGDRRHVHFEEENEHLMPLTPENVPQPKSCPSYGQFNMIELGTMSYQQKLHDLNFPAIAMESDPRIPASQCPVQLTSVETQSPVAESAKFIQTTLEEIPDLFHRLGSVVEFEEEIQFSGSVKGPILLHPFPRGKSHPCYNPDGLKVETCLRMCGIPYEVVYDCDGSGPWISYGANNFIVGAQNCIKFLHETFGDNVKGHLPKTSKKAPVWYIYILLEFHLSWGISTWRELMGENKPGSRARVFDQLAPRPAKYSEKLTKEELLATIRNDLHAITASLGNKKFLVGDSMTELDCSAFAILAQLIWPDDLGHPFKELMENFPGLVNYCSRIRGNLWSDWETLKRESVEIAEEQGQGQGKNFKKLCSRLDVGKHTQLQPPPKDSKLTPIGSVQYIQSPNSGFLVDSSSHQSQSQGHEQDQRQVQLKTKETFNRLTNFGEHPGILHREMRYESPNPILV